MKTLRALLSALALMAMMAVPAFAQEGASLSFELTVVGEPPDDATFFAEFNISPEEQVEDFVGVARLTDPDGDGVYTGGYESVPAGDYTGVRIVQGTGTHISLGPNGEEITFPGEPITVIESFGSVTVEEDITLEASVSYDDDDVVVPDETGDTGAGGIAGSVSSVPMGLIAGLLAILVGGWYAVLKRT